MNLLLEITLSDWTPTVTNSTFYFVKIFETGGKIVLAMRKYLPNAKHIIQAPDKVLSNHGFTHLELGMLKLNLEMMRKCSRSFVACFAPLGYEYDLEKYILEFENFVKQSRKEINEENKSGLQKENVLLKEEIVLLQEENIFLQKEFEQLERNYNKYKYEYREIVMDYHRLYESSLWPKHIELIKQNKKLEDLFQKEKFEKEQFITYCNNLNDKLMELIHD
jgi:hypothetical protein